MIYVTMTLSVLVIELMHRSQKSYPSLLAWISERWDNLLVSFGSGVVLCLSFPDIANLSVIRDVVDLAGYPSLGGLIIGLSSTPIINFVKKLTKNQLEKNSGKGRKNG